MYEIMRYWFNPMKSRNAYGYEHFAYVSSEEEAVSICKAGGNFKKGTAWMIVMDTPKYTYHKAKKFEVMSTGEICSLVTSLENQNKEN